MNSEHSRTSHESPQAAFESLRRVFATLAVLVGLALLGAVAGLIVAQVISPTDGEVRSARRSLVPPDALVTEQYSGHQGSFPPFSGGPYLAVFLVSGGGATHPQRVTTFGKLAENGGWHLLRTEESPGSTLFHLERNRIVAQLGVRRTGELATRIETRKATRGGISRPAVTAAAGATAGFILGILGLLWRTSARSRTTVMTHPLGK